MMRRLLSRAGIGLIASLALLGCSKDHAYLFPLSRPTPVVHPQREGALAIAEGAAWAVQPVIIHPEIEGSAALEVTDVRSDAPGVVTTLPASQDYDVPSSPSQNGFSCILVGVSAGTTTLRLYRDDEEVGAVPIEVIAQAP